MPIPEEARTLDLGPGVPVLPTNSRAASPTVAESHQQFMNSLVVLVIGTMDQQD
jgi:hypothetical protein